MGWPHSVPKHPPCGADRFIRGLCTEFRVRELARLCDVSDRTIRRWRDGVDNPSIEAIHRLVDRLFPLTGGAGPFYSPDMAIDGNSRVGGVGDYSLRAARAEPCFTEEEEDEDEDESTNRTGP